MAWAESVIPGIKELLREIGEDPEREGITATPARWCRALYDMTDGYRREPDKILATTFEESSDEMVVLRHIRFASLCEHHLFPFVGHATVAYLPSNGRVVGLSKIARLVECFARRLQIQERMTREIAEALMAPPLEAFGAAVIIRAEHTCMSCRGIRKPGAEMVTSAMLGAFREQPSSREEVLALARGNGN